MRRTLVLTAVVGAFVAGLGCRHVAGRCDCTNNPADAVIPTPSNPYPTVGAPIPAPTTVMPGPAALPGVTAPTPAPAPMPGK